jgi:hypothetical protein
MGLVSALDRRAPRPSCRPIRFADVAAVRAAGFDLERQVRRFVAGLGDPDINRVIDYKMLSGAAGSSPMWQMIQNLVNHARSVLSQANRRT